MSKRITPLTEEEWKTVGRQARIVQAAHQELISMLVGHVPKKVLNRLLYDVENKWWFFKSDLEEEMFRQGTRDLHILYGERYP